MSSIKPEGELGWRDGERASQAQTFSFPAEKQQLTNISPLTTVCVCVVKDYDHTQLVCVSTSDPPVLLNWPVSLSSSSAG